MIAYPSNPTRVRSHDLGRGWQSGRMSPHMTVFRRGGSEKTVTDLNLGSVCSFDSFGTATGAPGPAGPFRSRTRSVRPGHATGGTRTFQGRGSREGGSGPPDLVGPPAAGWKEKKGRVKGWWRVG